MNNTVPFSNNAQEKKLKLDTSFGRRNRLQSENIKELERKQKRNKKIILYCIISSALVLSASYLASNARSSYDIWLSLGNKGSKQQYISSLKGSVGDQGESGAKGEVGKQGMSAYELWKTSDINNYNKSESEYIETLKGPAGDKGISAYESWKASRPKGVSSTVQDYIISLKGDKGETGSSAYEIWSKKTAENKYKTEAEYIETLKGKPGDKGDSAYESWKKLNPANALLGEADYIQSLRGSKGDKGISAYEAWRNSDPANSDKTVSDYLLSLKGDKGDKGLSGGFKVGEIRFFSDAIKEDGWIVCDGQKFDPVKYTDLFYALGSDKVPNLKGRTVAMYDNINKIGTEAGANKLNLNMANLPNVSYTFDISHKHEADISVETTESGAHTHNISGYIGAAQIGGAGGFFHDGKGSDVTQFKFDDAGNHSHSVNSPSIVQNTTERDIKLNDGDQEAIDMRQATYYGVAYIFAGYD